MSSSAAKNVMHVSARHLADSAAWLIADALALTLCVAAIPLLLAVGLICKNERR